MEVYISINGVLRNFIQKFDYHYKDCYLESEIEDENNTFEYRITYPIRNDNLLNHYAFQSIDEFNHFCFIEYPLEIFGHAGLSYSTAMSDLNKEIYENQNINFTLVGLDELGKARSSSLFFLAKNGFLGNNIKFIKTKDIEKEWEKCDVWITDNKIIIDKCPKNKRAVKFKTEYNAHFTYNTEINNLSNIKNLCLTSWEKSITSTWTKLLNSAVLSMFLKNKTKTKTKSQKEDLN